MPERTITFTAADSARAMEAQGIKIVVPSRPISPAEAARLFWRPEIMPKTMERLA